MARTQLAGPVREHECSRDAGDPPADHRDRVYRRLVGPMDVFYDHDDWRWARGKLVKEQGMEPVRGRLVFERLLQRHDARHVAERPQGPGDGDVVAVAPQDPYVFRDIGRERGRQGRLADPRLTRDQGNRTSSCRGLLSDPIERGQGALALEEPHVKKHRALGSPYTPPVRLKLGAATEATAFV